MAAQLEVTFAPVGGRAAFGSEMPAPDGAASASETLDTASTASTISAGIMDFARVVNSGDADLYVAFGASPNPSQAPRWFLAQGQALDVGLREGDKVAFISK